MSVSYLCSFDHVRDQLSWLSQKMNDSLTALSNRMEQLEQKTATEHAQLTSDLSSAVELSRKGAWEYVNKTKSTVENQMSRMDKVST